MRKIFLGILIALLVVGIALGSFFVFSNVSVGSTGEGIPDIKDPVYAADVPEGQPIQTVDTDYATISVMSIKSGDDVEFGPVVSLKIVNKTEQDLSIGVDRVVVNDYVTDPMFLQNVLIGETLDVSFEVSKLDMSLCGFTDIRTLVFDVLIMDENLEELATTEEFRIIQNDDYDYVVNLPGQSILDDAGIKASFVGIKNGISIFGPALLLDLHNDTDQNVSFYAKVYVDGRAVDAYFSSTLRPGDQAVAYVSIDEQSMKRMGISDLSSAKELAIRLYAVDSFTGEDVVKTSTVFLKI